MSAITARPSGLLVPASELGPRRRVMARSKFLRLLRQMDLARESGLQTRFFCERCHEPVRLHRGEFVLTHDAAHVNPKTDLFSLDCGCSHWTIR